MFPYFVLAASPATRAVTIDPHAARINEIAQSLPQAPAGIGRPITDRVAWAALAKTEAFAHAVAQAEAIAARPIPPLTDEMYREFSQSGNRDTWQGICFQRRAEFTTLVMAECAENRGRFLAKINEHIDGFCALRTWVWPAHEKAAVNFNGIDLGAAELAWQLATTRWLLADRLTPARSAMILENTTRRVVQPYLESATGKGPPIAWMTRPNNWNAVCHACVVGAALATVPDRETRAVFIGSAEECMQYFLAGFGTDGYCTEGLGYWNYGFGHYVLLAETIRQATGGQVDLMTRPGVRRVAMFGDRIHIMQGISPAFADCAINAKPAPQIVRYVSARFGIEPSAKRSSEVLSERGYLYDQILHAFLDLKSLPVIHDDDRSTADTPVRSWFDGSGILIARPVAGSTCRIGVALKGGDNAETHNHNDLGSYVVVLNGDPILLDPGAEHYTARTFSAKRYESKLLNSYGHAVPIVAGQLQRVGTEAKAKILKSEFTDATDTLVMDLTSAYAVPELKRLQRTFVYDRRGGGALVVTDQVEFSSPQTFGTALITLGQAKSAGDQIVVTHDQREVNVRVDTAGVAYEVVPEQIHEDADVTPMRVGINLKDKVTSATITLKITPR